MTDSELLREYVQTRCDQAFAELVRRHIDDLVDKLRNQDRLAVLLRFFQGKSFEDMGKAMGVSEEVARKRTDRAVDKLRGMFAKRGFAAGAATLATALSANTTLPANAALAATTITTAMAATQATAVAGHALAIAKGALWTMAWAKAKLIIATGVALLFLGTGTTVMTRHLMAQRPAQPAASQPSAQGAPAAMAEEIVDNPEYQSWSRFKPGTTVTLSLETTTRGRTRKAEITSTLVELTAEDAVVEGTSKNIEPSSQSIAKVKDAIPAKVKKADVGGPEIMPPGMKGQTMMLGDEDVTVGGKTYTCNVVQFTMTDKQSGLKTTGKSWTCQEVPGRSVKLEASTTGAAEFVTKTTLTTVRIK